MLDSTEQFSLTIIVAITLTLIVLCIQSIPSAWRRSCVVHDQLDATDRKKAAWCTLLLVVFLVLFPMVGTLAIAVDHDSWFRVRQEVMNFLFFILLLVVMTIVVGQWIKGKMRQLRRESGAVGAVDQPPYNAKGIMQAVVCDLSAVCFALSILSANLVLLVIASSVIGVMAGPSIGYSDESVREAYEIARMMTTNVILFFVLALVTRVIDIISPYLTS